MTTDNFCFLFAKQTNPNQKGLVGDIHSSLLACSVRGEEKKFCDIETRKEVMESESS
jgi:hypothetical protein